MSGMSCVSSYFHCVFSTKEPQPMSVTYVNEHAPVISNATLVWPKRASSFFHTPSDDSPATCNLISPLGQDLLHLLDNGKRDLTKKIRWPQMTNLRRDDPELLRTVAYASRHASPGSGRSAPSRVRSRLIRR